MFILGHIGITLGAAVLGSGAYNLIRSSHPARSLKGPGASSAPNSSPSFPSSWLSTLGQFIDIRLLIIGSMLPDIIDKPVGNLFLRDVFNNGRIFSHTLLFGVIILAAGIYLYAARKQRWLLPLGIGTAAHLIFDGMWQSPGTVLWPVYGWVFPRFEDMDIIAYWVRGLETDPYAYIPEIIGAAILLAFIIFLVRRHGLVRFLKRGTVG